MRFVKWEYLSVARQGTIQTVRVSSCNTSIYVKQLIILIITAIQSHFYISRFVCWSLQMTYNRRNISLKVFEKNGSTSDIFMATFILFGHQFIIIWQACPILFAADRLPGSTKDCLIPQWKMIISCCLSLRFDWVTLQIYYIIWNFIFTPQDCCCNHMNLSLKEIQVCCVIVYIWCANLYLKHGFPKWQDAMEHIGAGLNLVVCYSSDNAGCVSVNSVQK